MSATHTYGSSSAEIADGIWRMTLREGNHYDTGFAYGTLLRRMGYPIIRIVKSWPVAALFGLAYRATRKHFAAIRIPGEYLDELRGYSDATGISYNCLYFINFCFDILKRFGFHCSTISLALAGNRLPGVKTDVAALFGGNGAAQPDAVLDLAINILLSGEASPETRKTLEKQMNDPRVLQASLDDPITRVNEGMIAGLVLGAPEFQRR